MPPRLGALRSKDVWLPGALLFLLLLAYLFLLYARDAPVNTRFTWALPIDNSIPLLFANLLDTDAWSHRQPFLGGEWQTSDRPPLQAALVLATRPLALGAPIDLAYQVVATTCQLGWLPALYALGRQLRLTRRQLMYVMLGCSYSGFFFLNTVYTWPKLLAGWLFIVALTLLMHATEREDDAGRLAPLVGALLALSLLAHNGTAFSMLAFPVLWLTWRSSKVLRIRHLLNAAMVCLLLLSPWLAYQRFYDPPGNRLLKLHLAGLELVDSRSVLEAVVDQYARLTPTEYLLGRWTNLYTQVKLDPRVPGETVIDWVRRQQFFHHAAALDLLCLGLFGLWLRPRREDAGDHAIRGMRQLASYAAATVVLWCIVMFTSGAAIIHQGSYAATMLLFMGASVGLVSLPRPIRAAAMSLHVLLFITVWLLTTQTSMASHPLLWKPVQAIAGALFLMLFTLALFVLTRDTLFTPSTSAAPRRLGSPRTPIASAPT
jgi:hypothetical protein